MSETAILVPVFVLAAWTGVILVVIAARRLTAGLSPKEFALGESAKVPVRVSLPNRNLMNLLELPVLFYVVCLVAFMAQPAAALLLPLAWLYVMLRIVHSLIHITYNNVLHRFLAFALSNGVLIALWAVTGLALFGTKGAG
jgi:hypothetical protein